MLTGETQSFSKDDYKNAIGPAIPVRLVQGKTQFLVIGYEQEGGFANTIAPHLIKNYDFIATLQYGDLGQSIVALLFVAVIGFLLAFVVIKRSKEALALLPYILLLSCLYFVLNSSFISPILSSAALKIGLFNLSIIGCPFACCRSPLFARLVSHRRSGGNLARIFTA